MINELICFLTIHEYNSVKKIQEFDRITKFSWTCKRCGKEKSHIHYNGINNISTIMLEKIGKTKLD